MMNMGKVLALEEQMLIDERILPTIPISFFILFNDFINRIEITKCEINEIPNDDQRYLIS